MCCCAHLLSKHEGSVGTGFLLSHSSETMCLNLGFSPAIEVYWREVLHLLWPLQAGQRFLEHPI